MNMKKNCNKSESNKKFIKNLFTRKQAIKKNNFQISIKFCGNSNDEATIFYCY